MKLKLEKKQIIDWLKENYILVLIIGVGFAVRWWGIYFDYPFGSAQIWDEVFNMTQLIDRIEHGSLFGGANSYPFLLSYVYLPILILRVAYIALTHGIFTKEAVIKWQEKNNLPANGYFGPKSRALVKKING